VPHGLRRRATEVDSVADTRRHRRPGRYGSRDGTSGEQDGGDQRGDMERVQPLSPVMRERVASQKREA
jgi:hypothetical protein